MTPSESVFPKFSGTWKAACIIFLLSLPLLPLFTHSLMQHAPEYDELLHIMAARGVNESGTPAIADGIYTRASLYTRLVASVNSTIAHGEELVASRVPALIFGVLLIGIVGAWVTLKTGWLAGLSAASILAISPLTINMSVLVRFYTIHTLLITIIFILWYEAISAHQQKKKSLICIVASVPIILLAMHLHNLTQISVLALSAGVMTLLIYPYSRALLNTIKSHPILCAIGIALLLGSMLFIWNFLNLGTLLRGSVPLWSADKSENYAFYLSAFAVHLPLLWPLLPLMIIIGLINHQRFTLYCTMVLITALVVNSIAAQKATRYFFHTYPMFCILWGVGFQGLVRYSSGELSKYWQLSWQKSVSLVLLLSSLCLINAHEVKRALKLAINRGEVDNIITARQEPDWSLATQTLNPLLDSSDTIIVTSGVKGLYFFGQYHYELSTTVAQETDSKKDFGMDKRSGRQVIGQSESVEQVISDAGSELFVLENRMLNKQYSVPSDTVAVLKNQCEFIDLSNTGSELSAWLCK